MFDRKGPNSADPMGIGHPLLEMALHWAKSWQNGTNESFNGQLRDECLSNGSARAARRTL